MSKKSASSTNKSETNPPKKEVKSTAKKSSFKKEEKDFGAPKFSKEREEKKVHSPKPKKFFEDDEDDFEVEQRFVRKERKSFDKDKKHFNRDDKPADKGKKHSGNKDKSYDKSKKHFKREKPSFEAPDFGTNFKPKFSGNKEKRSFDREDKPFDKGRKSFDREKKPYDKDRKPYDKDRKPFDKDRKPYDKDRKSYPAKEIIDRSNDRVIKELAEEKKFNKRYKGYEEKPREERADDSKAIDGEMLLNKFIAHSGECSRRDAAEMVKQGKVRVNGELILQPAYKVQPGDTVTLGGKKLTPQKGFVYILLNKPKDYITTTEDPTERKTVMDLVENSGVNRLFTVGRLDRKTTGLLLLTNDGNLAHKLSHPSFNIKKVYQVTLDKNLTQAHYQNIAKGVMLEDGFATVDSIAYLENRNEIGLELHSGKNRIVRRIFESLGYEVEKLDRVMYAGLTKKNLPRGKWRFLEEKEVIFLKHFK